MISYLSVVIVGTILQQQHSIAVVLNLKKTQIFHRNITFWWLEGWTLTVISLFKWPYVPLLYCWLCSLSKLNSWKLHQKCLFSKETDQSSMFECIEHYLDEQLSIFEAHLLRLIEHFSLPAAQHLIVVDDADEFKRITFSTSLIIMSCEHIVVCVCACACNWSLSLLFSHLLNLISRHAWELAPWITLSSSGNISAAFLLL